MDDLRVCLVQADLVWEDKTKNLELLYAMLITTVDADVIVLPEMFATGFTMNAAACASLPTGPEVQWMKDLAAKKNACVVGSLIILEDEKFYNRLFWVWPNGTIKSYNKRHLFTLAGEEKVFTAGTERLVVEHKGWKIMPLVCYDLRFPVWSRNNVNYDVLLYVANWPERRSYAWQQLLKARAIENQSYVVGLNRVGTDGNGIFYSGDSVVLDPLGEAISTIPHSQSYVDVFTLIKENLAAVRKRFGFLADQDAFELK